MTAMVSRCPFHRLNNRSTCTVPRPIGQGRWRVRPSLACLYDGTPLRTITFMSASLSLLAPSVSVEPGREAAIEVRLRNAGGVVDEFTFDVLGDAAPWASVEPPTLSLFPGAEGTARVVFRPPRSSAVPAGVITFGLRARSRENPAGSSVEEGTVEVGGFLESHAELVPRTSRGSGSASHELAVDNRGNTRLSAEISATDQDRLLAFDVRPPAVVVEPGMAGFAQIRVKPVGRFWQGQPKARPFQLTVATEGTPPILLDGTMLQEAILPPWFKKAVLMALGLLVALVILWLFVLKPSISALATEAAEAPVAELRDDVNKSLGAAGLPTVAPGGGGGEPTLTPTLAPTEAPSPTEPGATTDPGASPTPAPTPAPTDSGILIPGLGSPVDGRLDQGNALFAPKDTLFVTDLIFSNANGREGALVLLRNTTPLLQLRLENFRDYDLHFVTPIVIGPGDSLVLSLQCTTSPCDPAVFWAGYLRP